MKQLTRNQVLSARRGPASGQPSPSVEAVTRATNPEPAASFAHAAHDTWAHRVSRSPRQIAQRRLLGTAFGPMAQQALPAHSRVVASQHFPGPSQWALGQPPVQRFKQNFPAVRNEENNQWKTAAPFQLATVQFDAAYDIEAYKVELQAYAKECQANKSVPLIDFRFYDAAFEASVNAYEQKARTHLEQVLGMSFFDITFSLLRDETLPPVAQDTEPARRQVNELQGILKSLKDVKVGDDPEVRGRFARDPGRERKLAALDQPVLKMLTGEMMVPAEEALEFTALSPDKLDEIYNGTGETRYSLHHRLLAKALLQTPERAQPSHSASRAEEHGDKSALEKSPQASASAQDGPRRLRSNSDAKPNTLTLTNLVTGDESQSLASTLQACEAAFSKGTSQVLLIIEEVFDQQAQTTRPQRQITALKLAGYDVVVLEEGLQKLGPAQQSGVNLIEPGKATPPRWKIKVRKEVPRAEQLQRFAYQWRTSVHPMSFYQWKLWRTYDDDSLDAAYKPEYEEYVAHVGRGPRVDREVEESAKQAGFAMTDVLEAMGF